MPTRFQRFASIRLVLLRWSVAHRTFWGALALLVVMPGVLLAAYQDQFESPEVSWRLADADCALRVVRHERSFSEAHSGQGSEHLQLVAGQGTYAHLVHEIERGRVISEWMPMLWVKSDRGGLQFAARVVLPRSQDPRDGRPLSALLRGDSYDQVGSWQQLTIRDADQLLDRQVRILRSQFGPDVDPREAYVDMVVLNAFGGVGVTNLWIDDLAITGSQRPLQFASNSEPSVHDRASGTNWSDLARNDGASNGVVVEKTGTILKVAGRPFFPRIIEHNGETFELLQSLGFNTIRLHTSPTSMQLGEADRLGLWLVCPPPNDDHISPAHDRVLAWDLGNGLTADRLELTRQLAGKLRQADIRSGRPLMAHASERIWSYSRLAGILTLHREPLYGEMSLRQFGQWLVERSTLARPGTTAWCTISTQPPTSLAEQWNASGLTNTVATTAEPQQIRLQTYHAIASGIRGLVFTSHSRLDATDGDTQLRSLALRQINHELDVIDPWLAGGVRGDDVPTPNDDLRVGMLRADQAQLLIAIDSSDNDQFTVGPAEGKAVSLVVPVTAAAPSVYEISAAGLQPLTHPRVPGGVRITLPGTAKVTLIAITQDASVHSHLSRTLTANRVELARARRDQVAAQLSRLETFHKQLSGPTDADSSLEQTLGQARTHLRHSELLMGASDYVAGQQFAVRAQEAVATVRRHYWQQAASGFPSPVASPFCTRFDTLPLHWEMVRRLQATPQWSPNQLPGGGFEAIEHLQSTGWRNLAYDDPQVRTSVELSAQSPLHGVSSLRLQVLPVDPSRSQPPLETAPIQIVSPAVHVRKGQIARFHGWINVTSTGGHEDGLQVFDSIGGRALGYHIPQTEGWKEFVLYRCVPYDGNVNLTFALADYGEASIDGVSITLHESIANDQIRQSTQQAHRLPRPYHDGLPGLYR